MTDLFSRLRAEGGAVWSAWVKAVRTAWSALVPLIGLNLLWLLASLPVITIGPATLAAYRWAALVARDELAEPTVKPFWQGLRRLFVPGLLWAAAWLAVLALAYTSLLTWPLLLPPAAARAAQIIWVYGVIYLLALQPYLLEGLAVQELPWGEALKRSLWQVFANPLYSHLAIALPLAVVLAALRLRTFLPLLAISLALCLLTVLAAEVPWKYGRPRPADGREEDVL